MSGGFTRVLTLLASTVVLPFFFTCAAVARPKVGTAWTRGSAAGVGFFFYTPSLKGCKRMCFFYGRNCRPYAKSTFSPVLDCQTRPSLSGRSAAAEEEVQDACCVAPKCVYKRRRASRLAFKSFRRGRRFLKLLRLPASVRPF